MTIDPTPSADEIAAILTALSSGAATETADERNPKPSMWRLASRDYASDFRGTGRGR